MSTLLTYSRTRSLPVYCFVVAIIINTLSLRRRKETQFSAAAKTQATTASRRRYYTLCPASISSFVFFVFLSSRSFFSPLWTALSASIYARTSARVPLIVSALFLPLFLSFRSLLIIHIIFYIRESNADPLFSARQGRDIRWRQPADSPRERVTLRGSQDCFCNVITSWMRVMFLLSLFLSEIFFSVASSFPFGETRLPTVIFSHANTKNFCKKNFSLIFILFDEIFLSFGKRSLDRNNARLFA